MKTRFKDKYEIDDSLERIDFSVLEKWLSETWWSPGIGREEIIRGANKSTIVVGCYGENGQVGYLRVVSDKTRFAYFMDVFVDERHRRKGIASAMMQFVMNHPDFKYVYQWLLATKDAHGVYEKLGFRPLPNPGSWMMIRKDRADRERFEY